MSSVSSSILAAYRNANSSYANVEPNSGTGWWPNNGSWQAVLPSISVEEREIKGDVAIPGTTNTQEVKSKAVCIRFNFQLIDYPESPGNQTFKGAEMQIPLDARLLVPKAGKTATKYSIDASRLAGHLLKVTGLTIESIRADFIGALSLAINHVQEASSKGTPLIVQVRTAEEDNKYTDRSGKVVNAKRRTEWITELHQGQEPTNTAPALAS